MARPKIMVSLTCAWCATAFERVQGDYNKASQLKYGALVVPLAVFLLLTFVWPITALLKRSVDNPEIVAASDRLNVYEEGCLSIPEQFAEVTRPAEVTVRWIDRDGVERQQDFAGLWATCVQHEIDHLDGKLFIDYLTPLRRQLITRKMTKLKRERARD